MFIYNMKINGSKTFKHIFFGMTIIVICVVILVTFKIFKGASNSNRITSCLPKNSISKIESKNYTNILKTVHDNIDPYVGKKLNFTGYIYRVFDLNDNQFILARDMIVSSDHKSVIVGFLCEYDKAKEFEDNTWVELTGEIYKGNYHGDMPILKILDIKPVNTPNEEYVYPPDETYIPTSSQL